MSCDHAHEKPAADKAAGTEGPGAAETKAAKEKLDFRKDVHLRYFMYTLRMLPEDYEGFDTKRMMILYLALSGLDVLGELEKVDKKTATKAIDWIYAMQKVPPPKQPEAKAHFGFRGGPSYGGKYDPTCKAGGGGDPGLSRDEAHIAMTYSALCALRILGDDLGRVDKKAITRSLQMLQRENGCFRCASTEEDDMRFMYCACVISDMLGDWSGVDKEAAVKYIVESQAFDGGIGLRIGAEGHGGTTYCAVASLVLMGRLDALKDPEGLVRWCVYAQGSGFVGRPNKPPDSCYSFWIGATMKMLGVYDLSSAKDNRQFNLRCQTKWGGFGKYPDVHPDILHSYFGICGLSMMGMDGLRPIDPVWGITLRAAGKEKQDNSAS